MSDYGMTPVCSTSSYYYSENVFQPQSVQPPVQTNFSNPQVQQPTVAEDAAQGFLGGATWFIPGACGLVGGAIGGPDAGYDWDGGDVDADSDSDTDVDTDSDSDTDTTPNVCDNEPGSFGLSSPTNHATSVPLMPTLYWDEAVDPDLGDSVSYCIQIDNDSSFASPIIDECDITGTSYAVTSALDYETQYYWNVSAEDTCSTPNITDADSVFDFVTVDAGVCESSPGAFDLTAPPDTATGISTTPTLNWEDSIDPDLGDTVSYCVQLDNNSDFSSPIIDECDLPVSQYAVPTALDHETLYYWRATAADSCSPANETDSASEYSFTTVDAGTCATSPSAFALTSPPNSSTGIATTPTLDWADSTDPDTGDSVTYCVEVDNNSSFTSPEVSQCGLTESYYTIPSSLLSSSTTYYWWVRAIDLCSQETANILPNYSFTTEDSCTPFSFSDTDFTSGTLGGGAAASSGSIMLAEDSGAYTYQYEGDVMPTTDGWTQGGSFVSASVSGGELDLNTLGSNVQGYYEMTTAFNNTTGSLIEFNMAVNNQDDASTPANAGFMFRVADGAKYVRFAFFTNNVCEPDVLSTCYALDATLYHTYSITTQGSNYILYVDGTSAINGTGMLLASTTDNHIRFGDQAATADSAVSIDYLHYYNGGISLPYITPGAYTGTPVNSGIAGYNYSGAEMNWSPTTGAGQASVQVRAADTIPGLASESWSSEITANPAPLPAISGQYLEWKVNLYAVPPTDTPVIDQVDGERVCP